MGGDSLLYLQHNEISSEQYQIVYSLTRKRKLVSQEMISLLAEDTKDLCETIRVPECQHDMMIRRSEYQVCEIGECIFALYQTSGAGILEGFTNG